MAPNVEDEVKQHVHPPFASGVEGLENFMELLQNVNSVATLTEVDKVASELRPHVTRAYNKFYAAHKKAAEMSTWIACEVEAKVAQQHQIQCEIYRNEAEEISLSNRIDSIRSNVSDAENQVSSAKSNLSSAESTLNSARDELRRKESEQTTVAIAGAAISFIPIAGWITGPTMVATSLMALAKYKKEVDSADKAVSSARDNVRNSESRLNSKREELRGLENELSSKRTQWDDKQRELSQRQRELDDKKETQKRVFNMSEQLKYLTTSIATTLGRTKVLRGDCKTMYTLATLQEPLRAIAAHFQFASLSSKRLLSEMDFTALGKKFQMICDKTSVKMISGVCYMCPFH